jgi:hypothetical protein
LRELEVGKESRPKKMVERLIDGGKALAEILFDPKLLYIRHRIQELQDEYNAGAFEKLRSLEQVAEWKGQANVEWTLFLSDDSKEAWGAKSRCCHKRLPLIKESIVESLRANPAKSFRQLAEDIGGIVSERTIRRWLKERGTCYYTQRALPLLSPSQKEKHVAFCRDFLNNWGLVRQKIFLVHYDEKWWFGMLLRGFAKLCEDLGLEKVHHHLYHKSHIPKVMAVCLVGYAYERDIENGGHGIKLGLYRSQKARTAARLQRASRKDENGKTVYDGEIIRRKGDAYLVDCNVTGSCTGTASDPKFALKDLFQSTIFPAVASIVGPGGRYEGYLPVFQGDNAGPHEDQTFKNFVVSECENRGWKWKPQAAQMPYMNVLDLQVFPSMSRRHSRLLANYTSTAAPLDEIWKACLSTFAELDSATIARAFVTANRVARKVVEHGGENGFLRTSELHTSVRRDFQDTDFGIVKRVN